MSKNIENNMKKARRGIAESEQQRQAAGYGVVCHSPEATKDVNIGCLFPEVALQC